MNNRDEEPVCCGAVADFTCSVCGKTAARVELILDEARLVDHSIGGIATGNLAIEGFLWDHRYQNASPDEQPAVRRALLGKNARALHNTDDLRAPFYCPECDAVYCAAHWQVEEVYDEDFPGWYDCAYGTCPRGHRRMVDD